MSIPCRIRVQYMIYRVADLRIRPSAETGKALPAQIFRKTHRIR